MEEPEVKYGLWPSRTIPFLWMGFALFTIAFWVGHDAIYDVKAWLDTWGWQKTACKILGSKIVTQRSEGGSARFQFHVRYQYERNNQQYESNSRILRDEAFSRYEKAKRVMRNYEVGEETVCHVNPSEPSQAVLQRGSFVTAVRITGTFLLLLFGFLVSRAAFRKPKPELRKKDHKEDKEEKSAEQKPTGKDKILGIAVFLSLACLMMSIPFVGFWTILGMILLSLGLVVGPSLAYWVIGTRLGFYKEEPANSNGSEPDSKSTSSDEEPSPISTVINVVITCGILGIYSLLVWSMVQHIRIFDFQIGLIFAMQISWFFIFSLLILFLLYISIDSFVGLISGDSEEGFSSSNDRQDPTTANKLLSLLCFVSWFFTFSALAVVFAFPARKITGDTRMSSGLRFPLSQTRDIAVDSQGHLYCIGSRYKRVQVYSPEGRFVRGWFSVSGDSSLAIDANDRLHVYRKNEHYTFDTEGLLLDQETLSEEQVAEVRKRQEQDVPVDTAGNRYEIGASKWLPEIVKISPDGTESVVVRDPWYLWIVAFPRPSGVAMIATVLSFVLFGIMGKSNLPKPSGWGKPGRKALLKQEDKTDQAEEDRGANEVIQPDQQ